MQTRIPKKKEPEKKSDIKSSSHQKINHDSQQDNPGQGVPLFLQRFSKSGTNNKNSLSLYPQRGLSSIQVTVMNPDPLAQYTVLKTMLSESSWKRFSDIARARTLAQRVRKGQKSDQAQVNRLRNQAGSVSEELIPLNFSEFRGHFI